MPDRVRIGVLGLGAVAQAVHLPLLDRLTTRFDVAALADLGVTSAQVDLKAACTRVERLLERYAEPMAAPHGGLWPGGAP